MSTTRYTITTAAGDVVTGYVQGNGGYLREDHRGLATLRMLAQRPELVGRRVYEPEFGCVAVDVGTSRQVFIEWTLAERMAHRRHVPIAGATIELDGGAS